MNLLNFIKTHQQKIVLVTAFLLVAAISFFLGRMTAFQYSAPEIKVEQAFVPPNYNGNVSGIQSAGESSDAKALCAGQIKGSSSLIYHLPSGAFYDRVTKPVRCFDIEQEAINAGFKKSSR